METHLCSLCKKEQATKLNSHIIPSFMIARVCSYDGSGKRDKEVMFTLSPYEDKIYTGQIPSTKYEELFDTSKLTDERINTELKDNTTAKDFIFCPECEKRLSIYLESPYSAYLYNSKKVDGATAYFFWMSIVWRMSVSSQFNFNLPPHVEAQLQEQLNEFISQKALGHTDFTELIKSSSFRYRLIISPDYLSDGESGGFFGGFFDENNNLLSLSMGDKILCITFNDNVLPANYSFYGFEDELKSAIVNNGLDSEKSIVVTKERFAKGIRQMISETAARRLQNEKKFANVLWQMVGLPGSMPDIIFQSFIERLYSENVKIGDRKTMERYIDVYNETLQSFGYIPYCPLN